MGAAKPYPWPYDGTLELRRLALVIAAVAGAVRSGGGTVVHIRHSGFRRSPSGLPPIRSDDGWELVGEPSPGDIVVDAAGVDGFYGGPLDQELRSRGVDTLVLCGFGAEAAVSSTRRSANDRGYECLTLTDASAPFDAVLGRHDLHSITMSGGIFGAIAPSEALLSALAPVEALT